MEFSYWESAAPEGVKQNSLVTVLCPAHDKTNRVLRVVGWCFGGAEAGVDVGVRVELLKLYTSQNRPIDNLFRVTGYLVSDIRLLKRRFIYKKSTAVWLAAKSVTIRMGTMGGATHAWMASARSYRFEQ